MARRYLQTGPSASPDFGGVTSLAIVPANVNLPIEGAAAPTVGQVFSINGGGNAEFLPPPASGIVDDPTVRTSGFTAVANTRYFVDTYAADFTAFMPAGPVDGDVVAFIGLRDASCQLTVNGNGHFIRTNFLLTQTSSVIWRTQGLNVAFRYSFVSGLWETLSGSVSASFPSKSDGDGGAGQSGILGFSSNRPLYTPLFSGDSVPGRIEFGDITELRPWMVAHNLFSQSGAVVGDNSVGSQVQWLFSVGTAALRAHSVYWYGNAGGDLIVRGMYAVPSSSDFRQDKVVTNVSNFYQNRNIVWKGDDTTVFPAEYRVRHDAPATSTDFPDYVQGPGQTVTLRWNPLFERWYVIPSLPSGMVNRSVATNGAGATIIHAHQTNLANRVISYKVQVEALETVGTPGQAALYDIAALFQRDGAGVVVQKGATAFMATIEDNAAWNVTFTISGTIIEMRVEGDVGATVQWRVVGNITEHG